MNRNRLAWGPVPLLVLAGLAASAGPRQPAGARDDPLQGPVDIRSERLEVHHEQRRAVFSGKVRVSQGRLRISCQRLQVFYEAGTKAKQDRQDRVKRMVFSGGVDIELDERRGHCREAVYFRRRGRLLCNGEPWVLEGGNRIRGEQIEYLLREKIVRVKRPRAVLHLPEQPPAPARPRPRATEPGQ